MIDLYSKNCLECNSPFHGRADKKFCSDQCRSAHHNRVEIESRDYIRRINHILKKNRRILTQLQAEGKKQVGVEKLKIKGFDFNYFTSFYTSREGIHHYYCYDHGFLQKAKGETLVLVQKEV
jgi:hypothetical protein